MRSSASPLKILDFDIENRPSTYWYDGETTSEMTAVAAAFADDPDGMNVWILGRDGMYSSGKGKRVDVRLFLFEFLNLWNQADMVTGHFIRRHDLGIINAHLLREKMGPLPDKLTHDTKIDMNKKGGVPATQEHLADMLDLKAPKYIMSQKMWRESNQLTPLGLTYTETRVTMDVVQHMELRLAMIELGWLKPPKMWRS